MYILNEDLKLQDWQFSQRKNLPYEEKIILSRRRIRDWYENYEGDVYVSFSGGIDSTVLADLVRKEVGRVPLVFVNTGLEYKEITEFVTWFDDVVILRPEMSYREVIMEHGYPLISKETASKIRKLRHGNLSERYRNYLLNGDERGSFGKLADKWKFLLDAPFEISEKCCDIMKKNPILYYSKKTGRVPYIGITQDEGFRRQHEYNRTGCNVYDAKYPKSQPLGFWTHQDILRYIVDNHLPFCKVYGQILWDGSKYINTGVSRTGCVFCCMGCQIEAHPNRFERMKIETYQLYDYCMRPIYRNGLGLDYVLNYCNILH